MVTSCNCVLKRKPIVTEKEGEKFKDCLVEKVYSQKNEIDYDEIFCQIIIHISIMALLVMVVS